VAVVVPGKPLWEVPIGTQVPRWTGGTRRWGLGGEARGPQPGPNRAVPSTSPTVTQSRGNTSQQAGLAGGEDSEVDFGLTVGDLENPRGDGSNPAASPSFTKPRRMPWIAVWATFSSHSRAK
jgi:hypothetical protein